MSQSAMSTPLIALKSTGPLRQSSYVARLPDVLDLVDVAPDQERLEYSSIAVLHDQRSLRERRAAPADQPRLGRFHFDDDQPDAIGRGQDGLDVANLDRRRAAHRLLERRRHTGRDRARDASPDGISDAPPAMDIEVIASRRFIMEVSSTACGLVELIGNAPRRFLARLGADVDVRLGTHR